MQSIVKICQWDFSQSSCFKALCEKSNDQPLDWSFLDKGDDKQTTEEIKFLRKLPKVQLNFSVRPS